MKHTSWQEKLIGSKLAVTLSRINWEKVGDSDQEVGFDCMENEWRRQKNVKSYWDKSSNEAKWVTKIVPGFKMWTTIPSQYRESVHLPLFLTVNGDGIIEDIEIEAYGSYGPGHGRPDYINVQKREFYQVGRILKALFQEQ